MTDDFASEFTATERTTSPMFEILKATKDNVILYTCVRNK